MDAPAFPPLAALPGCRGDGVPAAHDAVERQGDVRGRLRGSVCAVPCGRVIVIACARHVHGTGPNRAEWTPSGRAALSCPASGDASPRPLQRREGRVPRHWVSDQEHPVSPGQSWERRGGGGRPTPQCGIPGRLNVLRACGGWMRPFPPHTPPEHRPASRIRRGAGPHSTAWRRSAHCSPTTYSAGAAQDYTRRHRVGVKAQNTRGGSVYVSSP